MECNECEKEVACIYMICPDCVEAKDREIATLQAQLADREAEIAVLKDASIIINKNRDELVQQLADREERLALWREGKDYFSWSPFERIEWRKALKAKGEI